MSVKNGRRGKNKGPAGNHQLTIHLCIPQIQWLAELTECAGYQFEEKRFGRKDGWEKNTKTEGQKGKKVQEGARGNWWFMFLKI